MNLPTILMFTKVPRFCYTGFKIGNVLGVLHLNETEAINMGLKTNEHRDATNCRGVNVHMGSWEW